MLSLELLIYSHPLWYFINDLLTIIFNLIGISITTLFIYTVIRLDHPSYSIATLTACKTCLAIGFLSSLVLFNSCYAIINDFRGITFNERFCFIRGIIFTILYVNMYTTLCLKAFNRLQCIVYRIRPVTNSYRSLFVLTLFQWIFVAILVLPIILSDGFDYDQDSHLCLVTTRKPWQFIFLMIIYYISILFIFSVYIYILYYVLHISRLERYRQKRQMRLLRRILILLLMLILPGIFYLILVIYWIIFQSIPLYVFKIRTLIDSIGYTGVVITILISNTRLRHQYSIKRKKKMNLIRREQLNIILYQQPQRKITIIRTSFTLEKMPINI
ncbi:hypothetical protein I4U23_003211 [Adineta vaga]|nr:hypothetical protein I4U23_003211 [Adineta vaga]